MWQPNKAQWWIIWVVAVLVILAWPPDNGRSLAVKAANWLADPTNALPTLPEPLPIALEDNPEAVAAHDSQETEYYRYYSNSRLLRLRINLKSADDPFDPLTARQILVGIAILGALAVWRLNEKTRSE